jgi:hypothetical protein
MMQDSLDLTTLIFLGLAVFVIWKLRSVLGQKFGASPALAPAPGDGKNLGRDLGESFGKHLGKSQSAGAKAGDAPNVSHAEPGRPGMLRVRPPRTDR